MLRTLLILPLCLWLTAASAVNLDSLWGVWSDKTQPDTNRMYAIYHITIDYIYTNPDSALFYGDLLYNFAESLGNKKWMAAATQIIGGSFDMQGNYEKALEYYEKGLLVFKEIGFKKGMANSLNNIGLIYSTQSKYENALLNFQETLKLRKEIDDQVGISASYSNIGGVYNKQNSFIKALECYNKSLEISAKFSDKSIMSNTLKNIGQIYDQQGNTKLGVEYIQKSLAVYKEIKSKYGMANCYSALSVLYDNQGNYDQGLYYYKIAIEIYEEIDDKSGLSLCLLNMGMLFEKQGNFEQALGLLNRALDIYGKMGDKGHIATINDIIGRINFQQGNHEQALYYYQKALETQEKIGDKDGIVISCLDLGNLSFEKKEYTEAIALGRKGLKIAQDVGLAIHIRESSKFLYDVYKKSKQPTKALEMHELYIEMRDSINSIENKEAIIKMEYQYQYEKQQALEEAKHQEQMALSAEREKRQQLIAYSAGGGLVMVLGFAFFIFNRLQITRRQKRVIEEQKELVEEQKKDITDSIAYAENIQRALLPDADQLSLIPDGFVLFQPKDIVSGDFYWMQHHKDVVYLAVCDCTGHGVPGAFMSMIGSSQLDEAVIEKGLTKPNEIFYEVRKGFINALKQTGETGQQKDGMDAAMFAWDKKSNLKIAAAFNPVLIIRKGDIHEIKPDRQPVGFFTGEQKAFTHHEHKLEKDDTIYIFSDGYPDQFGGEKGKKFKMANFKKLLLSIQDKKMNEQKTILEETMAEWKGDTEQIDDILVIGVRF